MTNIPEDSVDIAPGTEIGRYLTRKMPRYLYYRLRPLPYNISLLGQDDNGAIVRIEALNKGRIVSLRPRFTEDKEGRNIASLSVWLNRWGESNERFDDERFRELQRPVAELDEELQRLFGQSYERVRFGLEGMGFKRRETITRGKIIILSGEFSKPYLGERRSENTKPLYNGLVALALKHTLE